MTYQSLPVSDSEKLAKKSSGRTDGTKEAVKSDILRVTINSRFNGISPPDNRHMRPLAPLFLTELLLPNFESTLQV